jgi:hypothetical protein
MEKEVTDTTQDMIDAIDELVDWQMEQYPSRSGYDNNVNQLICPHCGEDAHTLPIRERMREIRGIWRKATAEGCDCSDCRGWRASLVAEVDAYRYNEDDSPILCSGAPLRDAIVRPGHTDSFARFTERMRTSSHVVYMGDWSGPDWTLLERPDFRSEVSVTSPEEMQDADFDDSPPELSRRERRRPKSRMPMWVTDFSRRGRGRRR